jgi:hypothetical protein
MWLIGVLILVAAIGVSQDFRDVSWGMTVDEVVEAEGDDYYGRDAEYLLYRREIIEHHVNLMYMFDDGTVITGGYLFPNDNVYDRLHVALSRKYGEGVSEGIYQLLWLEGDTYISLTYDFPNTQLVYASRVWFDSLEAQQAESDADQL